MFPSAFPWRDQPRSDWNRPGRPPAPVALLALELGGPEICGCGMFSAMILWTSPIRFQFGIELWLDFLCVFCFPCGKLVMWYSATFFIVFGMFHYVFYLQFRLPGASCLANDVVSVFDPVRRWATSVIAGTCWILAHCAFNFGAWRCNLPYATRNNWFCSESAPGLFDWVHMQKANYHLRILTAVTSPIVCY